MISTEGASSLTKSVANNVTQGTQIASDLMGVDLAGLLAQLATKKGAPALAGAALGVGTAGALSENGTGDTEVPELPETVDA